ncbi:MAG TPA: guanitoxin biosynthesis heme-dependent pre-guanitoxin N-hydroxylase GntA [Nitrospira sp.]|nr:guanitoxin biosynthesis heme-dependent pre-guanitoxin N-hydroxylase GntA [Nitrospira sp.]
MQPDSHHMPLNENGVIVSSDKRQWNPLSVDPVATRFSSYAAFHDETVIRPLAPDTPVHAELIDAHIQLQQKILGQFYPCVGAISAFSRNRYRFGLYPELACESAVGAVCHDLYDFCHEFPVVDDHFVTFIAMFHGPTIQSEQHFEDLLWNQLQAMHSLDSNFFAWDKSVDADPQNHHFSFSIGGRAMYVIGMHPKSSRLARTSLYPTMVFNLHEQFTRLCARGKFETMKQAIRMREMTFQGSVNPMLASFGENSEARQYSGRAVPADWSCPFHSQKNGTK